MMMCVWSEFMVNKCDGFLQLKHLNTQDVPIKFKISITRNTFRVLIYLSCVYMFVYSLNPKKKNIRSVNT